MKMPKSLSVLYHGRLVGTLSMTPNNRRCVFEYSQEWLSNGFSISPLELPLKSGLMLPRTDYFYGDFGIFEDSMPDGYGNYLLNKILQGHGTSLMEMTPVERLSVIGSKGMGALEYAPETTVNSKVESVSLDRMQQDALDVLSEKDFTSAEMLYINSGNSRGCRPKCIMKDEDGFWLVKFRHTYDPLDIGVREYEILKKARECGITIPDFKLFNNKYLGTRRFDITPTVHACTSPRRLPFFANQYACR